MIYKKISPDNTLEKFIECYWIVENDDPTPVLQKIIPDGFPEMIFDYREPYRICLNNVWKDQTKYLLAGQIRSHFFLENKAEAGMIGVKFKPAALTQLFGMNMSALTDDVVDLPTVKEIPSSLQEKLIGIAGTGDHDFIVDNFNDTLKEYCATISIHEPAINLALELLFKEKGLVTVEQLAEKANLSERQLERQFSRYIGLSPKFYARIIRFSYIFELIQEKNPRLTDIAYDAGYFDQSHFIRNFKAFTGEDPSKYGFNEQNFANFFLRK